MIENNMTGLGENEKDTRVRLMLYPDIIDALESVFEVNGAVDYHTVIVAGIAYVDRINAGESIADPEQEADRVFPDKKGNGRIVWSAYRKIVDSSNQAKQYRQKRSEKARDSVQKRTEDELKLKYKDRFEPEAIEAIVEEAYTNADKNQKRYAITIIERLIGKGVTTFAGYLKDKDEFAKNQESRRPPIGKGNPALVYQKSDIPEDTFGKDFFVNLDKDPE